MVCVLCKVHLGDCVGLCVCVCMQMSAWGWSLGVFLYCFYVLTWGTLLNRKLTLLARLTSSSGDSSFFLSPTAGLMYMCSHSGFLCGCWRFKLRLCKAGTLIPLSHHHSGPLQGLFIWNIDSECNSVFYFICSLLRNCFII